MLSQSSSLLHPIYHLLLSGVIDGVVVETAASPVQDFEKLAEATTELTAALLVLTCVLLILSLIFLLFLMLATVRWPGPRW